MLLHDSVYPCPNPATAGLRHIVLTRFNMRVFRKRSSFDTISDLQKWVDHRTAIFESVCLPSVIGQEVLPHRWYIGVDGRHPEMVGTLAELCVPYPWIVLVEQREGEKYDETFRRAISEESLGTATHLLTTRLDCDDALALDYTRSVSTYVQAVLGANRPPDDFWLAFPIGAQLADGSFSVYVYTHNPFLTRVVAANRALDGKSTVLDENHSRVFDNGRVVHMPITSTPMWLQYVHDRNITNILRDDPLVLEPAPRLASLFGLEAARVSTS